MVIVIRPHHTASESRVRGTGLLYQYPALAANFQKLFLPSYPWSIKVQYTPKKLNLLKHYTPKEANIPLSCPKLWRIYNTAKGRYKNSKVTNQWRSRCDKREWSVLTRAGNPRLPVSSWCNSDLERQKWIFEKNKDITVWKNGQPEGVCGGPWPSHILGILVYIPLGKVSK